MRGSRKRETEGAAARIGVGLISLGASSSQMLDACRNRLESYFSTAFPTFEWELAKEDWDLQWADPLWLLDRAQARMEDAGWQFSFLVTDHRGHAANKDPATLSFSHSSAIVYLPDITADGGEVQDGQTTARCCHIIITSFARLNGLPRLEQSTGGGGDFEAENPLSPKETAELEGSLQSLADGILKRGVKEIKGLALYARVIFSHPMRVLRTVWSHRPLRMVFSLGKLVFAAMAALVLALLSTELWYLGVGINIWRLALIAVAVLLTSTLYVVFRQQLYVHRVSRSLSEQAAFFNLTSFLTVFCVLLALFLIIFVVTILVTVGAYPRYIIEDWVMQSDVGFIDYVRVSLLISSMAMVVGALGAGLEENQHFRQVMYTERNR
jgi:hypothetical protein